VNCDPDWLVGNITHQSDFSPYFQTQPSLHLMSLTDWVTLDVGGRVISTYRSTLVSSPTSMLAKMFSPHSTLEPAKTHNGHYNIDTDPDIFTVILNWLRYQKVLLPTTLTNQSVSVVAEYFGLTDLVDQLAPSPPDTTWPEVVTLDVRGRKINVNRLIIDNTYFCLF